MPSSFDRAEVINEVIRLLESRYIFLDVAQAMGARLREHQYALAAEDAFADEVQSVLHGISNDKHLRFRHDPKTAAYLKLHEHTTEPPDDFIYWLAQDNFGFRKVEWLPGRVGYLDLRKFQSPILAGEIAVGAMAFFANAEALIFDLRHNSGGQPEMIQLITSYLFAADPIRHLNSFYFRAEDRYTHYWTLPYVPGKRLPDADVYVLTSDYTFSGAEEFAYNLKTMGRATLIGETTGGGAHPIEAFPIGDQFVLIVPNGRAINPITQTNWEGTGVAPDVAVPAADALRAAHQMALEKLLGRKTADGERASLQQALKDLTTDGNEN